MASSDFRQVTTIVRRLGDLLNPVRLVAAMAEVITEVSVPPPGDPAALEALATAYRTAAEAIQRLPVPQRAPRPFTDAANALAELAVAVREQQRRHAELRQRLEAAARDATQVGVLPMLDPTALDDVARVVTELVEVYTSSLDAANRAAGRFADVAGRARLAAAVAGGLPPRDAVVLADAMVSVQGIGDGYDDGILSLAQLRRAGRSTRLRPVDGQAFADLLRRAGSDLERAWLYKALAAGHEPTAIAGFADRIRGRDTAWLDGHLSLIDKGGTGVQRRLGIDVRQYEDTTCGTTSLVVTRAEADPLYAMSLTDGDFAANFAAERARVHDRTNVIWPEKFGTSPPGMAGYLNAYAAATGTEYRWHLVDDTDPRAISTTLREVVTAADRGHPVPVLIGGPVPRHYILVVGHSGGEVLIYEPTGGDTVRVDEREFLTGNLTASAGFDHVQAVVVPV